MSRIGTLVSSEARRHPWLAGVTALYVVAWTVYGLGTGNSQVYAYLAWMISMACLVTYVDYRVRFSNHVLVLLCIVGFCHMAGGNVDFDGVLLYEQAWGYVRYDHLVHAVGLGAAGLAVWEATRRMLAAEGGAQAVVVIILGGNAIGAWIEMGEYLVTLVNPSARVGGYVNSMQDLIANLVGTALAAWWVWRGTTRGGGRRTRAQRPPRSA